MKTSFSLLTGSLFLFCAIGCGSSPEPADCQTRTPSIANGVYGCVTSTDDTGDMTTKVFPDFTVQAFSTEPSSNPEDGLVPEATSISDAVGFYEMKLPAGRHWICTGFRRCIERQLATGTRRLDYSFSLGPGWPTDGH